MPGSALHPESLLHIPLAAQLFSDPDVTIAVRGIDSRWAYSELISGRLDGFNPFHGAVFVGQNSYLARWLPHRDESARPFNRKDGLVGELLFAIHDYLHIWCYRWILELWPELGFGTAPIVRTNFEDMVFCHLLSEAAATVGLDYWYLACVRLGEVTPIGSTHEGLTASYREEHEEEYRRFDPGLKIQSSDFLATLTRFYCDGAFPNFSVDDMERSPLLHRWLIHELSYGELQRRYSREWFAYLSGGAVKLKLAELTRPVGGSRANQRRVTGAVGELLWRKVKNNEMCGARSQFDRDSLWCPPAGLPRCYQFVNINRDGMPERDAVSALSTESFKYLLHQYIARFDHAEFPDDALVLLPIMYSERNLEVGRCLLKDMKQVSAAEVDEPLSMFFLN